MKESERNPPPNPTRENVDEPIIWRPIAELKLDANNPRSHPPKQIRQLARSIQRFGFIFPILIDAENKVIAGTGRVLAAKHLGMNRVRTIRNTHLTDAQIRVFRIADNRLAEHSVWNNRLLAQELRDLSLLDLDFSLELTGFEIGEIDFLIESLNEIDPTSTDPADDLSLIPTGPPVTRLGDLWDMGRHRVGCANAMDCTAWTGLLQGKTAQAGIHDPPYNVRIGGNVSGLGRRCHREFTMASGEMTELEFVGFLIRALSASVRFAATGSLHYIFIDWRHVDQLLKAARDVYSDFLNLCVWVKNNAGMGSLYRSQHELVGVFRNGKASHRNNVQLGRFGRNRTNVWQYPGANSFSRAGEEGNLPLSTRRSSLFD